eukprot:gene10300-biopygen11924
MPECNVSVGCNRIRRIGIPRRRPRPASRGGRGGRQAARRRRHTASRRARAPAPQHVAGTDGWRNGGMLPSGVGRPRGGMWAGCRRDGRRRRLRLKTLRWQDVGKTRAECRQRHPRQLGGHGRCRERKTMPAMLAECAFPMPICGMRADCRRNVGGMLAEGSLRNARQIKCFRYAMGKNRRAGRLGPHFDVAADTGGQECGARPRVPSAAAGDRRLLPRVRRARARAAADAFGGARDGARPSRHRPPPPRRPVSTQQAR